MSYIGDLIQMARPPIAPKTPEDLWKGFVDYVAFVDEHKVELPTYVSRKNSGDEGKGGKVNRPLSLVGFMAFLGLGYKWNDFRDYYKQKEGFSAVITRIEVCVENNQLDGAMAGVYQHNLVARLNGYTDKQDITSNGEKLDLKVEITRKDK